MAVGAFGEAARRQRRRQEVAQPGRDLARPTRVAPLCPSREVHHDDRGPVDDGGVSHLACRSPRPAVPRQKSASGQVIDLSALTGHNLSSMITLLLHLFRLLPFLFGGHRQLAIENLALRHQLSVYKRTMTRPKLRTTDRLFWVGLARVWAGWSGPS
jgi:hypothetical protein